MFTDLTGPAPPGLKLSATIDTRFSTTPTTLKLTAMVLAIVSTIVALIALWRLDQLDGHRMRRLIPVGWTPRVNAAVMTASAAGVNRL
ncbi:arabinosyltransferase domain-containing protein [Mycobacterium sp. E3298]|uniref:arabinosyltransferase domain-containing protein n=1 Tax=Mycobacterium sp. E3298 TaxID=1856865 RepID=UPI001E5EF5E1|nr:arabinosyltransferase domain-containing protein [Mycobacterium sp. E3298]